MTRESVISDREILEAALASLESQRNRIDEVVRDIRSRLNMRGPGRALASTDGVQPAPVRRKMSSQARRRIVEATRRRWIAFRKAKGEAEKPPEKPKRKFSKAGLNAIREATRKRWAAFHKAQRAAAKKTAPVAKKAAPKTKARKTAAKVPASMTAPALATA
jgi:hypothetical protein